MTQMRSLARKSLWMILVQIFNKLMSFFLPFTRQGYLESRVSANMASQFPL